jgi:hypothetical protein
VEKQRFEVTPGTVVRVERVEGHLTVHGWDRDHVQAVGCDPAEVEEGSGELVFTSRQHCRLRVPQNAKLAIEEVHGRVAVEEFEGEVTAESIGASFIADGASRLTLESVSGDFTVHSIAGDVVASAIGGSCHADGVGGSLRLEGVGGNLVASRVSGDLVASVGGNAVVRLEAGASGDVRLGAGGNIRVDIGEATPASIQVSSGAGSVRVIGPDGTEHLREPHVQRTMAAEGPSLQLAAGGRVALRHGLVTADAHADPLLGEGLAAMAEEYAAQIEARFEGFAENFTHHIDDVVNRLPWMLDRAGLGSDEAERIARKVAAAGERALRRAEHRAARAVRHAERRQARGVAAQRRAAAEEPRPGAHYRAGPPPAADAPDEERQLVLRLLASGRITAAEADELLAAIGATR